MMSETLHCKRCGAELTGQAVDGQCANCMLKLALDPPAEAIAPTDSLAPFATSAPEVLADAVGLTVGRYKLLEKIGEGGCGVVHVAEQTEPLRRRVALKVIKLGMDTREVIARFEAERQALAMMDHPNIAKVLDAGTTPQGRPYFVMELVRGIRITDYCDQEKLATRQRLDLFIKVCQAIQHAHQKGIIHRDIKPSNILVTLHDGVPVPKVIDFGIAKATEGRLTGATVYTQLHQFIGTPAYMSPEQAEMSGLDIDTRTDIYSLGVLLYQLLTGKTPFDTKELMSSGLDAFRKAIREQEPPRPSTRLTMELAAADLRKRTDKSECANPKSEFDGASSRRLIRIREMVAQLRGDLDWIVMKCLEKDRARRYDTANGLAADIQRHLNNEPVIARPPNAAYRFQKAFRRNQVAFTAAAVVAMALVAGTAVSTWQMFEARSAQLDAERARQDEQAQRLEAQSAQKVAVTERERADAHAKKLVETQRQSRRALYASDIYLAQQALEQNNVGSVRRLLDRHRPQSGEEDLRGWEWRYLWQFTRSEALITLTNRVGSEGSSVSFSADGTHLAVGWSEGRVDLWNVPARRRVRALTDTDQPHWGKVAFSPVGNVLVATSSPEIVMLYDLDSGRERVLWQRPVAALGAVRSLAFSRDGSRVVIYSASGHLSGDEVSVVNVASGQTEYRHSTTLSKLRFYAGARLSPDNRRLHVAHSDFSKNQYTLHCIDLATDQELWRTETEADGGVTALNLSPDGRFLASASGYQDTSIRIWDALTGRFLKRLDGHKSWVSDLAFSADGRRLVSAGMDQIVRFWDTGTWTEAGMRRGHSDAVFGVSISPSGEFVASVSRNGELLLWKTDGKSATDDYLRLPETLRTGHVLPLDRSHLLLLPPGQPPELINLKRGEPAFALPEIASGTNVLGWFGTNLLCHWDGTNRMVIHELRDSKFVLRGTIPLNSSIRPITASYNAARQLFVWIEQNPSSSVFLASLDTPSRRTELRSDVEKLSVLRLSEDGNYIGAGRPRRSGSMARVWHVDTGRLALAADGIIDGIFAARGRVMVVCSVRDAHHEIAFYDLSKPGQAPRRVSGESEPINMVASPDGGLVVVATGTGSLDLYDPIKGERIKQLYGHLNVAAGIAFSPDGRRLISTFGGADAVKVWDLGTHQEMLTLAGTGSLIRGAHWTADEDAIVVGPPWQVWRAPSWTEIEAAERSDKVSR